MSGEKKPFQYRRVHLPSGSVYVGDFNASHDGFWSEGFWRTTALPTLLGVSKSLIQKWNSGPERTLWRYELIDNTRVQALA